MLLPKVSPISVTGNSMLLVAQAKNLGVLLTLFSLTLPSSLRVNCIGTYTFQNISEYQNFSLFPLLPPWSKPLFPLARIPAAAYSLVALILPLLTRSVPSPLSSWLSNGFSWTRKKKKKATLLIFIYKILHSLACSLWPSLCALIPHLLTLLQPIVLTSIKHVLPQQLAIAHSARSQIGAAKVLTSCRVWKRLGRVGGNWRRDEVRWKNGWQSHLRIWEGSGSLYHKRGTKEPGNS